ncbi:MBL fold metallo-hydrolase [Bacillus sp. 1P06AnD]|uniref:MBL fold metallo-hydrolase n=1 Tax=Bacillus sp. 1P06AnD TaxID=3132208 RepID=UPI0039A1F22E
MLLRYFYDEKLAHASYMVACQATGEAMVIDPMRHIDPYLKVAKEEGFKITGAVETHIHADFVSGSRELAHHCGSTLYLSDEGGEDWSYKNLDGLNVQLLKDGDTFRIGKVKFDVVHTPGHTPESLSFLLTDEGGKADEPMGIFTGDFIFVGDIGRPDLLEKAAGVKDSSRKGAEDMFRSIQNSKEYADFLQVWPAHGAGSACGKSLGAVPSSTIGYERRFNWAFLNNQKEAFIDKLLDGQPEPPHYFAQMKKVNKEGPALIRSLPEIHLFHSYQELDQLLTGETQVIDIRPSIDYAQKHIHGTINIPLNKGFANWAGWLVEYEKPLCIIGHVQDLEEVRTALYSIGADTFMAFGDIDRLLAVAPTAESYRNVEPKEVVEEVDGQQINVLDVRTKAEWNEGHIMGAQHIMLGDLPDQIHSVNHDKPLMVQCGSGVRSAIATSILQANGIHDVLNQRGGYARWIHDTE